MASLQEQLLKAGLANKNQAKQAEKAKKQTAKKIRKGEEVVDEAKERAEKARLAKLEKDRQLNAQQKAEADTKAIAAQIKQLIEGHALDLAGANVDYNFTDGTRIKRLQVTALIQHQLSRGMLAIAGLNGKYFVIPGLVADKIQERNGDFIISRVDVSTLDKIDEDDPYADYQIPDDLMW
ncbi:MAG: DUF2058 domain-containing protein [Oceanospirillaceae bacterium]|nr:DUF2058 domain-containing protein [Oceanospirillaceae bacterium]MCP5349629.1 DUF2058 domain-containing protein [Oceanospirillaceae bacterium]